MNQPKPTWEKKVDRLQKRLEELAIEKEMLVTRVKKAYSTLEAIKESPTVQNQM